MPDNILLPIGKIRKAHGIKGEVSIEHYADFPDILKKGIFLQLPGKSPVPYDIISFRAHHGALLLRLKNIDDRNAAETLRGAEIFIPESRLPAPDDGSIYLHEIMGLHVIASDENGQDADWGTISAVTDTAGQELWTISKQNENDVLLPATPEFIVAFDLDNGIVRIAPPLGLFELYRSGE